MWSITVKILDVSEIKLQNVCFELHIILESQFKSFPFDSCKIYSFPNISTTNVKIFPYFLSLSLSFFFLPWLVACGILAPQPGTKAVAPA